MTVKLNWESGDKFVGTNAFGHTITIDTPKKAGGTESGYKPTELLLYGLAGCTGVDVIRILGKMRQEVTRFEIEVTAHQGDDFPKPFHTFEVKYIATGKNLDEKKLAQAVELSETKCWAVRQTIAGETRSVTSHESRQE
jgi:putative redox protein